jgi:hypothetical protein
MCALISVASFPYFYVAKKAAQGELFTPTFSDLDPSDATKILYIREDSFQDQPYSVVRLDDRLNSLNVREAPEALLVKSGSDFAKLTAPNGNPVWIKGSAVRSVNGEAARFYAAGVHPSCHLAPADKALLRMLLQRNQLSTHMVGDLIRKTRIAMSI